MSTPDREAIAAAARTFRARALRDREARERRAADALTRVIDAVRPILPQGARAYLIGSLAWGGFGERSDVDLVLSGVGADAAFRLERAVAAAAGAEVDLLDLAELPESFRRRVLDEGIPLHAE